MMASTLACIEELSDTIFSKFCDINPSYSATFDNGQRFGGFKFPLSCFDPPLGCVYIICQDSKPVYVGRTYHLGGRFHSYVNSWDWNSTDIRTDHAANINKKILAGAEAGHRFELWIRRIKDESERVVVEKDTIHRTQPDWNNIMYVGKKRELGFDFNDQVFWEWAKDRMPFFDIFSDDYFRSGAQAIRHQFHHHISQPHQLDLIRTKNILKEEVKKKSTRLILEAGSQVLNQTLQTHQLDLIRTKNILKEEVKKKSTRLIRHAFVQNVDIMYLLIVSPSFVLAESG